MEKPRIYSKILAGAELDDFDTRKNVSQTGWRSRSTLRHDGRTSARIGEKLLIDCTLEPSAGEGELRWRESTHSGLYAKTRLAGQLSSDPDR